MSSYTDINTPYTNTCRHTLYTVIQVLRCRWRDTRVVLYRCTHSHTNTHCACLDRGSCRDEETHTHGYSDVCTHTQTHRQTHTLRTVRQGVMLRWRDTCWVIQMDTLTHKHIDTCTHRHIGINSPACKKFGNIMRNYLNSVPMHEAAFLWWEHRERR